MNSYEVSSHAFSDTDFIILVGENFPNKQFIDCPLHIFLLKFSECHPDVRLMIAKQKFSQGTDILSCSGESDIQESRPHVYP